jgi:hypothetical protein
MTERSEIIELKNETENLKSELKYLKSRIEKERTNDRLYSLKDRPQLSGLFSGSEINGDILKNLSIHELHNLKLLEDKNKIKKKTILDENLGDIFNKCINFLDYSYDGYEKSYDKSREILNIHENEISKYDKLRLHLLSMSLFVRENDNTIYVGIILVFLSIIILLTNILIND